MQELFKQDLSIVLAITGGGTEAIGDLLRNGGASNVILEANVPYSHEASAKYVGAKPEHFCSRDHALNLAVASYYRAKKLTPNRPCLGLGSTARLALASGETEREGRKHEVWVATHDDNATRTFHFEHTSFTLHISSNITTRQSQEISTSQLIIHALYEAARLEYPLSHYNIFKMVQSVGEYRDVYKYDKPRFWYRGKVDLSSKKEVIYYPGSFNPIHEGHLAAAEFIYKKTQNPVVFELCIHNTDKPTIDYMRLHERIEAIWAKMFTNPVFGGIVVTNTPFFIDKTPLLHAKHFLIGMDVYNRLQISGADMLLDGLGAKFYVLNRIGTRQHVSPLSPRIYDFISQYDYVDCGASSSLIRKAQA